MIRFLPFLTFTVFANLLLRFAAWTQDDESYMLDDLQMLMHIIPESIHFTQ